MMKKFISILLVLGMLCTVLPFAALPAFAATDKVKVNVLESNSGSCGNEASYEFSKVKKYADANGIAFKDAIVVEKKRVERRQAMSLIPRGSFGSVAVEELRTAHFKSETILKVRSLKTESQKLK